MPSYYRSDVSSLISENDEKILAALTTGYVNDRFEELKTSAISAWEEQLTVLKRELRDIPEHVRRTWHILLEFSIPRRRGRIDAALLANDLIVVLEFKSERLDSAAAYQVEDYCLDLVYFHKASRDRVIVPIVVGSDSVRRVPRSRRRVEEGILETRFTTHSKLADVLGEVVAIVNPSVQIDPVAWDAGEYYPVPTVIEAAVGLFQEMEVDDIAHADTDPKNLSRTIDRLREIILTAHREKRRVICFVTGVPGAGKTLAGLKLVHDRDIRNITGSELSMLSGNGPLVSVLRAALALDQRRRKKIAKRASERDPATLIQPVYGFKNGMWHADVAPQDHVLVFDEAQRAWDKKTNLKKLKAGPRKCEYSEPGLILSILSRHKDWTALVALIGGGQEIHTGEAGLEEWGRALNESFSDWKIFGSPQAINGDAATANNTLFGGNLELNARVQLEPDLHLDNPTRQFRGKTVAEWTESVLAPQPARARRIADSQTKYPIVVTRSLESAKEWLRQQKIGSERYGLIASSGAKRLRADGISVSAANAGDIEHWFLAEPGDVRSSFQLEVAATEFQIQGLEIDWAGICWGGDFTISEQMDTWELREFLGSRWLNVRNEVRRQYIQNTYRVLLTRARLGFVIYMPPGDLQDPTNLPERFDRTAEFLISCGVKSLD